MFLWHFPSGYPAPPLAGILPGGARTFLPPSVCLREIPKNLTLTQWDGGRPASLRYFHCNVGGLYGATPLPRLSRLRR